MLDSCLTASEGALVLWACGGPVWGALTITGSWGYVFWRRQLKITTTTCFSERRKSVQVFAETMLTSLQHPQLADHKLHLVTSVVALQSKFNVKVTLWQQAKLTLCKEQWTKHICCFCLVFLLMEVSLVSTIVTSEVTLDNSSDAWGYHCYHGVVRPAQVAWQCFKL